MTEHKYDPKRCYYCGAPLERGGDGYLRAYWTKATDTKNETRFFCKRSCLVLFRTNAKKVPCLVEKAVGFYYELKMYSGPVKQPWEV